MFKIYFYTENKMPECFGNESNIALITNKEELCNLEKNAIVASDVALENFKFDIGIGKNYRGNASYVIYDYEQLNEELCYEVYCRKNKIPMNILETKRFVVREISLEDLDALYELYDTVSDCKYIEPLYERSEEEEFTRQYIENMYAFFGYGLWLVFDKESGKLVARAGIENRTIDGDCEQELGYVVDKRYQRQGIALEVCSAIVDYARNELGLSRLFAVMDKTNIPSITLAEKLGFKLYAKDIDGMNIYIISFPC